MFRIIRSFTKSPLLHSVRTSSGHISGPFYLISQSYHRSRPRLGIEEFFDSSSSKDEALVAGRAWTAADLRRKSYQDLHALWWVLYKERNLLLTARERARRASRPYTHDEESRYLKVKRSMAGIKHVINERKDIEMKINPPDGSHNKTPGRRTRVFPNEYY